MITVTVMFKCCALFVMNDNRDCYVQVLCAIYDEVNEDLILTQMLSISYFTRTI